MKVNFEIVENMAIRYKGIQIDLHNNFDFIGIKDKGNNDIVLEFSKANGDWIRKNEFEHLTITFKNISYKYFENGDPDARPEDSKCLGELTFFPSELREINNSIVQQEKPKDGDDIIFYFEDGRLIRLNSEYVELKTNE